MSFTRMRYHFVTATRRRKGWLSERVQSFLRGVMRKEAEVCRGKIITAEGLADHEHIVAAVHPAVAPAEFIGRLKAVASHRIRKDFPTLDNFA